MRKVVKIAFRELKTLFYSPVAWLILVVFFLQAAMAFTRVLDIMLMQQFQRPLWYSIASGIFTGTTGILHPIQGHLYLYIPLLTMGLISREYGSGTIKLLYSSPVTTLQIVMGKFLSMMIYGLALVSVLFFFLLFLNWRVPELDVELILSGILGTYLLVCTYTAIGLFMSSLTSYQIVAAIGTLAVLSLLNQMGYIGQQVAFLRDITYWLSINGRAEGLSNGLIRSEDICYFLLVIGLFLTLTFIKIQSGKQKMSRGAMAFKYTSVFVTVVLIGYVTSLPPWRKYYDATATKTNTLTLASQDVMNKLTGGLTITTYVNLLEGNYHEGLASNRNVDKRRFDQYTRFKPEIKMKYVYYYADPRRVELKKGEAKRSVHERALEKAENLELDIARFMPPEEMAKVIDLASEEYRFVRLLERESGEKTFLRMYDGPYKFPRENEITTALKRLVTTVPRVAFLSGHGERDIHRAGDRDYYTFVNSLSFRYSLINNGFDIFSLDLAPEKEVPEDVSILIISDLQMALTPENLQKVERYVQRGGNLVLLAEPGKQAYMEPVTSLVGVHLLSGTLVQPTHVFDDNLLACRFTEEAKALIPAFKSVPELGRITMPGAVGLVYDTLKGFQMTPLLQTLDTASWNELETTDFVDGKALWQPQLGEKKGSYTTMMALSRSWGEGEQRIMVLGDADCFSNAELLMDRAGIRAYNFDLITSSFRWLTHDEFPLRTPRPSPLDKKLLLEGDDMAVVKLVFMGILPLLFVLGGALCLTRRKMK